MADVGTSVVHAMQYLGDDQRPEPAEARAELDGHLRLAGVDPDRAVVARYLHRMMTVSAMPTPARGGLAGRPAVDSSGIDNIFVAGDWVGPTGYLADGSLVSGEAAGRRAAASVPIGAGAR